MSTMMLKTIIQTSLKCVHKDDVDNYDGDDDYDEDEDDGDHRVVEV